MRKFFALTLVALLSLTLGMSLIGCAKKEEEPSMVDTTMTTTPPPDTGMAPMDTTMSDTTSGM